MKYDGNGDAIAVWERVADPNFTNVDLSAMAAQMEIVWSRWSRTNGAWSEPAALTSNSVLDHTPLLCGPMSDGSVLAVWTRNQANLLMGTNGVGANEVLWAGWDTATRTWTTPQTLVSGLAYRLSQSLVGAGDHAAYAWTADADGVLTNDSDQELFVCEWQGGAWQAARPLTANSVADKNVRLAVLPPKAAITVEGFESGDFTALPWTFSGNAAWTVQSSEVYAGSFAAQFGCANVGFYSMRVNLNCAAGQTSFAYNFHGHTGMNQVTFRFSIDGQTKVTSIGTGGGWVVATNQVTPGVHNFEWSYSRLSTTPVLEKLTIDQFAFPASTPREICAFWQSGANLVMSGNLSTKSTFVRPDSQTAGFADYAVTAGPAGNLVLLWQEMSTSGSDAHYMVYDLASDTWSRDMLLCKDPPLEGSFAPAWDNVGNLTVAYDKTQVFYTNKTVTLEGGGEVTITNVPQPGRVDLVVTKRALVKDLALLAGDFTAQGNNYLPGDTVALSAMVRNTGDVAVSNVVVGFYDGNPDAGGVLLANVALPGWLEAAATNTANARWVVPEPAAPHVLYAVANRANLASEFNLSNNVQSVSIGGTDLATSLVSYRAETNGAVRVIAQVQNLGAPTATNSVLAIRLDGATNAPLATAQVPVLEAGRLAQVALDLPLGTQPAGEAIYRLFADETGVVADVDTNNNTMAFAVNLWIDSDEDGIPDSWMMQYFGHVDGQAGDRSRPQDDTDGDGMINLAEYLAGTNPKDAHSYLRISSVSVGGTNGVQIAWGSATNKLYSVQRASALGGGARFTDVAQHILSTPPENAYLDTTATNSAAFFYRVRLE